MASLSGDLLLTQADGAESDSQLIGMVRGSVMLQARSGAWCEGAIGNTRAQLLTSLLVTSLSRHVSDLAVLAA